MAIPPGYRLIETGETGSTNADCLARAREGDRGRLWISAQKQNAGRGSRGRTWDSEAGNLFCSLLLIDPGPARLLATLTFVAALAVREAIREAAKERGAECRPELKWPNDVLVAGRKVAGILLEHHADVAGGAVVVGIGVNCRHHPADTLHPATDLAAQGVQVSPRELLDALMGQFPPLLAAWARGEGFAAIRREWLEHATGIGRRAEVRIAGRTFAGTVEGIDAQGYLELRLADGRLETLSAADVFFGKRERN